MTMEEPGVDRVVSRQEIATAMQAAFELCATCAHTRSSHSGGLEECEEECFAEGEKRACPCGEFWEWRRESVDGLRVMKRVVSFGGGAALLLDRRTMTELWDSLEAGEAGEVRVRFTVEGRGYRVQRDQGEVVGVTETRKVKVMGIGYGENERDERGGMRDE